MILSSNLNVLQEVYVILFSILLNNVNFREIFFVFQISTWYLFIGNLYSLAI